MLYERWREIVRLNRDRIAVRDVSLGQQFNFGQLDARVEQGRTEGEILFPSGHDAEFILDTLRAWRAGSVVCPLEAGHKPLEIPKPPGHIVHLKMTSATTGAPRLVAFTAPQLMADAENIMATMGLRADWPNLGVISLAHSYGFSNLVLPLLLHGIPLILLDSALPEILRRTADAELGITLAAVPALWRAWHDAQAISANVRLAISAGAPLPLPLERSVFSRFNLKIHNFYGSSECGGIAYDRTDVPRNENGCVGSAMNGVQLALAEDGCLEVRGAAVGENYWPQPGPALGNGVFRTSDLAEIRNGFIHLHGRAGDQINVAGRKVLPEAIEKVILAHPGVRECVVLGIPSSDPQRVEEIAACIVATEKMESESLRQFLLERLPAWQVPREWRFVDSLSPNNRGKISRSEWRKTFFGLAKANS